MGTFWCLFPSTYRFETINIHLKGCRQFWSIIYINARIDGFGSQNSIGLTTQWLWCHQPTTFQQRRCHVQNLSLVTHLQVIVVVPWPKSALFHDAIFIGKVISGGLWLFWNIWSVAVAGYTSRRGHFVPDFKTKGKYALSVDFFCSLI